MHWLLWPTPGSVQTKAEQSEPIFVDFRKAFDSLNHNILLRKFQSRNTPRSLIKCFFYT